MAVYVLFYPGLLYLYTFYVNHRYFHENEASKREKEAESAYRLYANDFWTQRPKINQIR